MRLSAMHGGTPNAMNYTVWLAGIITASVAIRRPV